MMRAAVLSNSLILLVLIVGWILPSVDPDLYYRVGQADSAYEGPYVSIATVDAS